MTVFQRSFFETKLLENPADPAIGAKIWAHRELITNMDVDFFAGDATRTV